MSPGAEALLASLLLILINALLNFIFTADAVSDPRTMMIHSCDASAALTAIRRANFSLILRLEAFNSLLEPLILNLQLINDLLHDLLLLFGLGIVSED